MSEHARPNLAGLERNQLTAAVAALQVRRYVPGQLFRWLYGRGATDFARMTDLSKALRAELGGRFRIAFPEPVERHRSADGTCRYGYRLDDGERIESVAIPGTARAGADGADTQVTLCLSSQAGCPLACTFCVSGVDGVRRNLTSAEIVGQARAMLDDRAAPPQRVNVVFMGMGEALLNFDEVLRAVRILADPEGFRIALRRMTMSTAGHVPSIDRFSALDRRPRLAVSLNATTDEQRAALMPINKAYPLAELLAACRRFRLDRKAGERITFEYVLLAGENDTLADARRLPRLLAGIPAKVNLIPWNPVPGLPHRAPHPDRVEEFGEVLRAARLVATVRKQRGAEADAACGQLALRRMAPAGGVVGAVPA